MVIIVNSKPPRAVDEDDEASWNDLYPFLRSTVHYLVYSFQVASWRGQEEDIVEDLVQETMRKLLKRAEQARRGEAEPIQSVRHMIATIASNSCKDLRRKDRRLVRMQPQLNEAWHFEVENDQVAALDTVTEQVFEEALFVLIAHEVAHFPAIQRKALLIDLANRMSFDVQLTPLQKAFLQEGIQLQHYQLPLPTNLRERSRHATNVSYAYQRVSRLPCVQAYIAHYSDSGGQPVSLHKVRHVRAVPGKVKKIEAC